MVKLTTDIVEKKCSQILTSKSLSKTIKKDELWKLTHLHMNDMFISSIDNIAIYKSLKVLYLQNNNISKIKNLHFACSLTHLYLQHNTITKMENLESLQNLQKLYLGYNNIVVIEGLENTKKLQELHIESQKIPLGESLCFDPRSAFILSMCLRVLNISDNKMISLRNLIRFQELHTLDAKNNLIDNMDDLTATISTLISLKDLSLQGNPVTRSYRYKENLIANSVSLANLDGKIVTDICRNFMKRFKMEKHNQRTRNATKTQLGDDITSSLNLPPAFKRSISRAIFQHPGPHLSITITPGFLSVGSQLHAFPLWTSASGIRSTKDNHVIPRPFWSNVIKNKEIRLTRSHNNKTIALPLI
ncbi:PREDICTED: protein phosphatase 1 regulatory subunit 42-like [Cyphomyrmex costatus]|uniref:Leucine-rich repeat-containing protein 67 n=1 Tax=Cyphomyrmex costatus TaxID=456900 RepID=A0A195D0M0_9HYME|nr:PREDICTED: protein phosphatase 1 regulatory subunit 42-like [Cyphomyrmex costatus]KYN06463.1 Leucine-rich repeat-containing protein 67 [Cyphomyrmex costatus]